MYSRFLNHTQALSFRSIIGYPSINGSSVPDTSNVSAGYYLYKMSSLDVTYFDKADVEQQDIRCVHGDTNCCAFPLNYASWSPGLAIIVYEKPELCSKVSVESRSFRRFAYHHNRVKIHGHRTGTCLSDDTTHNALEGKRN
jgi:hypothetical protein